MGMVIVTGLPVVSFQNSIGSDSYGPWMLAPAVVTIFRDIGVVPSVAPLDRTTVVSLVSMPS
jgi:hypothetical protein